MSSLVRRLARNTASIRTHLFPKPKPYQVPYHSNLDPPESEHTAFQLLLPHLCSGRVDKVELRLPVFGGFPFGFGLNPIEQIGSVEVSGSEEEGTMWADSVKKKRKRKMNKHKLRKLRKSLRRKT